MTRDVTPNRTQRSRAAELLAALLALGLTASSTAGATEAFTAEGSGGAGPAEVVAESDRLAWPSQ